MVGLAWLPVVPCEREALGEWCLWVDRVEVSRRPKRSWKQKSNRGKGLLGPLLPNGHPEKTTWYRPKYRTYNLCCRLALPRRRQSFCCRRLLDQKNLAVRLPLRSAAHLQISHETAWISRECPEDFFKTGKIFSRELFQSEDDKIGKIARKLTRTSKEKSRGFSDILNPLFITLCTSLLYYPFVFVVVLQKGEQDCWKNAKHNRFQHSLITFPTRHAVTSRYCFAHFQKWKRSSLNSG